MSDIIWVAKLTSLQEPIVCFEEPETCQSLSYNPLTKEYEELVFKRHMLIELAEE